MARPVPYEAIPNGWFAVAYSADLRRGGVVERRYFARDIVVYRTEQGVAQVRDAYCPHLGAHLGDATVVGERLRCPFHAFEFDGTGACVATPYGKRPPARARLGSYPVVEREGVVFVWFHAEGEPPFYELPSLDGAGYTEFKRTSLTFRGHPQEISENSSDLGHFGPVHRYASAEMIGEARMEGSLLSAHYRVSRSLDFIGLPGRATLDFRADVHGLGYSFVHARVPAVGIDVELLVMPTPIEVDRVELRLCARMKSKLPPPLREAVHEIIFRAYLGDLKQDIPFWERKRYLDQPALADGDGPIPVYRRYVRQFYTSAQPRVALPVVHEDDRSEAAE